MVLLAILPLFHFIPELAPYFWNVLATGTTIFAVLAAIKAYDGEFYEIPLVGKIARKQAHVDE
jgi:uncharacterized membrane protein